MINEKKIIYADLDPKEGVVLNLETKNYYRLNETGQIVWQGVAAGKSAEETAQNIAEKYDIASEAALSDVNEVVLKMKREGLIEGSKPDPAYSMKAAHDSKAGKL